MDNIQDHAIQDLIYKVVDGVAVPLRIFLPSSIDSGSPKTPIVVFIHGGSFTLGQHYVIPPTVAHLFLSSEWAIASIAHRLLPHVSIYDQVSDLTDAAAYLHNDQPTLDMDKWILAGHSSGAYIAGAALCLGVFDVPPRAWLCTAAVPDFTAAMYNPIITESNRPTYDPMRFPRVPGDCPVAVGRDPGMDQDELRRLWGAPEHLFPGNEDEQRGYATALLNRGLDGRLPENGEGVGLFRELFRADTFDSEGAYREECRRLSPRYAAQQGEFPKVAVWLLQGEEDVWSKVEWHTEFVQTLREHGYEVGGDVVPRLKHDDVVNLGREDPLWAKYVQPNFCKRAME